MSQPQIVSPAEWDAARAALLVKEKEATRALGAPAAERRRLPMPGSTRTTSARTGRFARGRRVRRTAGGVATTRTR
jgi:hypothetical protein